MILMMMMMVKLRWRGVGHRRASRVLVYKYMLTQYGWFIVVLSSPVTTFISTFPHFSGSILQPLFWYQPSRTQRHTYPKHRTHPDSDIPASSFHPASRQTHRHGMELDVFRGGRPWLIWKEGGPG